MLAHADKAGGTEEHALYGTPDELLAKAAELNDAGAEYALLALGVRPAYGDQRRARSGSPRSKQYEPPSRRVSLVGETRLISQS